MDQQQQQNLELSNVLPSASIKIRHDWYQTEMYVNVTILIKNVNKDRVNVEITNNQLKCVIQRDDIEDYELAIKLAHTVDSTYCRWKVTPSKVEIQLKKSFVLQWKTLEACIDDSSSEIKHLAKSVVSKQKNWDKIVVDITKDEKEECGDADGVFKKIYADADDDVRRAMIKSFSESGGTCLSTDWKDVSSKKCKVKAPDGLEWRQWEQ